MIKTKKFLLKFLLLLRLYILNFYYYFNLFNNSSKKLKIKYQNNFLINKNISS